MAEETLILLNKIVYSPITKASGILCATWIFAKTVEYFIKKYVKPKTHSPALVDFIASSFKNVIIFFAFMPILSQFGVDVQGIATGLGLTGFAVGFALKDTLANIIAGMFILLYRPFRIGQYIKIATSKTLTDEGFVKKIDLRYTTLGDDNQIVLIPNSILFTTTITILKKPPVKA